MVLYKITNGLGDWYVLSDTATHAQMFLENALNEEQYGTSDRRETKNIAIITNEVTSGLNSKYFFSSNNKLLIDDSSKEGSL